MARRWSTLVVFVVLAGCTIGSSDEGVPPTSTISPTTSSSTTSTTTPSRRAPDSPLMLASDGLGVVSFGDPVDGVMATLTDLLGPPSYDSTYESPFDVPRGWIGSTRGPGACFIGTGTGYSCFDYIRFAGWRDEGLWLVFSDLDVNSDARPDDADYLVQIPPSFRGYDYSSGDEGPLLYTADGITVGSTTADLVALGDRVEFSWTECGGMVVFSIEDDGEGGSFITGSFDDFDSEAFDATGLPAADALVRYLQAGDGGSC